MATKKNVLKVVIVLLLLALTAIALFGFNVESRDKARDFLYWMQQHLLLGATYFTVLYCVATGNFRIARLTCG
jgi:ABC-type transport system involved in multi-copper enzyme maturation permease subunit